MKKLLIYKDGLQNKLIEVRILDETENITYSIVEDAPIIEERETEIGHYELNEEGQVVVVYEPKPKTVEDKIAEQEKLIADLMLEIAMMQGGTN